MAKDEAHEVLQQAMMLELIGDELADMGLPAVQLIADDVTLLGERLKALAMHMGNEAIARAESKRG